MPLMICMERINSRLTEGDCVNGKKDKDKTYTYIDDSVDIGKEPTPITDAKRQEIHDRMMKELRETDKYTK